MSKKKPDVCYRIRCEAGDESYYLDAVCELASAAEYYIAKYAENCRAIYRKPPKMTIVKFVEETN